MKIDGKFYPLTPEMSRKLRKFKLTKHEMALWLYLIEKDPFGDKYWELPSTLEITAELEISKASYFRARARLQELELFDFQEQRVDCRNLTGVSKMRLESQNLDLESQKCDSQSQKRDSESQKCDSQSQKRDFEALEPLPQKDFTAPQTIQTYSDFIQTLSEQERESFEKFVKEEYKRTEGKDIRYINAFLRGEHFQEWYERYQNRPEAVQATAANKWQSHPQFENWLAEIERTGNPAMFASSDKEKQAFVSWCWETKQFSWLKEEGDRDGI